MFCKFINNLSGYRLARHEKGFTLIEITVALAIFAISIIVLSQGFLNALTCQSIFSKPNDNAENDFYTLKHVILTQPSIEVLKDRGGDFLSVNNEKIHWNAMALPTKTVDLFRVEALCTYPNHQKQWTFFLYNPKWTKEKDRKKDLADKKQKMKAEELEDVV